MRASTVAKRLLKDGIYLLKRDGHITNTLETDTYAFIDDINDMGYLDVPYSAFVASTGWTFDPVLRTITNDTTTSKALLSDEITGLDGCEIKAIVVDCTVKDIITVDISLDGLIFFTVDQFNTNEEIPTGSTFKIRITSNDNVVRRALIVYDKIAN